MEDLTRSQVAEHNSTNSVWITMGNLVYDLTTFLDEHPGGCEVLLENAGQDGTESFEDIGHSSDAREMRKQYCIGKIVEEEKWQYSYDKRAKVENDSAEGVLETKTSDSTIQTTIVYATMVGIIALIIYYLLLS